MTTIPKTPYELLGGAQGVRTLVERFYQLMDTLPEAARIRALHPADLRGSTGKLYKFLSGWLGGPALYVEEYGHPMLRARHLPFPIATADRDAWLLCMKHALDEVELDPLARMQLDQAFFKTADHMRNRDTMM
ncbi:MAG: group II truncated hemoglobin [Gammaproteobacteria bacterium]|nr:group II truncated hemoglobin [Gammaproteobacteria bacterium]